MSKEAIRRLNREFKDMSMSPPDNILAAPEPGNMLRWHFVILGPDGTPYEGGVYHGLMIFPTTYPRSPPEFRMLTPSGRFEVNKPLCLSMSNFHPETWSPAWSVATMLLGLLSFMLETEVTTGSIVSSTQEKVALAAASCEYNEKDELFCELFPYLVEGDEDDEGE
jgi:ubiquitin-conjugating enzyme E2 J2